MIAKHVSVTEAVRNFSDYINRIAYRHESFILCKGKRPIAELRPVPTGRRLGDLPALLASLPPLNLNETEDFAQDVATARDALNVQPTRDPWES